jgi:hypothetical protein
VRVGAIPSKFDPNGEITMGELSLPRGPLTVIVIVDVGGKP